jgi:hypothetical protein
MNVPEQEQGIKDFENLQLNRYLFLEKTFSDPVKEPYQSTGLFLRFPF